MYADSWVRGRREAAGERDCASRYEAIAAALDGLDTPSVLDVGANTGYFGIRLAEQLGGPATLADDYPPLVDIAAAQGNLELTVIARRLGPNELHALPRHDVTLALSVLHHFPDWRAALEELRACRHLLICEVPHPDERWMRHAASRAELGAIYEAVSAAGHQICTSERQGRDGRVWERETFAIEGSLCSFAGEVFAGSGTCSRRLPEQSDLDQHLGYRPFPGSLNLRTDFKLADPPIAYVGPRGRDYQFWPAWASGVPCHAMIPGDRGWPGSIEIVAPVKLRDELGLSDGDQVVVDVLG